MDPDEDLLAAEFDEIDDNQALPDYAKGAQANAQPQGRVPSYPSLSQPAERPAGYPAVPQTAQRTEAEPGKASSRRSMGAGSALEGRVEAADGPGRVGGETHARAAPARAQQRRTSRPKQQPSAQPSSSSSNAATTDEQSRVVAKRWKDVLVRAGLRIEFAWKHALALTGAGYDETNAEGLREGDLIRLGIERASDRANILKTIAEIASEMREAHATSTQRTASIWESLLRRAKLGAEWTMLTSKYAQWLAEAGWDESNVEALTEDHLSSLGIDNAAHREIILQLVERELAEAMAHPDAYRLPSGEDEDEGEFQMDAVEEDDAKQVDFIPSIIDPSKPFSKRDVAEVARVRRQVNQQLEAFEELEDRLRKIMRGDTDVQRQQRARREEERGRRKAEREEKRMERLIARMTNKTQGI